MKSYVVGNARIMLAKKWNYDVGNWVNIVEDLLEEIERLKHFEHEYICKRCGIRQNSNTEEEHFEGVIYGYVGNL